ncbi:MAG: hypothetical protein P4L40_25685, partial [Terracidiphilus sp.]|nr:hypothetical protein [Terracidiphilus sp.]
MQVLKYELASTAQMGLRESKTPTLPAAGGSVVPAAAFLQCRNELARARLAYAEERVETAKLDQVSVFVC